MKRRIVNTLAIFLSMAFGMFADQPTVNADGWFDGWYAGPYSVGYAPYSWGYVPYSVGYVPYYDAFTYSVAYGPTSCCYPSYGCCGSCATSCCSVGGCCGTSCGTSCCSSCCAGGCCTTCNSPACGIDGCCGTGCNAQPAPAKPTPDDNFRQRANPPKPEEPPAGSSPSGPNARAEYGPTLVVRGQDAATSWSAQNLQERPTWKLTGIVHRTSPRPLSAPAPIPDRLRPLDAQWAGVPSDMKLARD